MNTERMREERQKALKISRWKKNTYLAEHLMTDRLNLDEWRMSQPYSSLTAGERQVLNEMIAEKIQDLRELVIIHRTRDGNPIPVASKDFIVQDLADVEAAILGEASLG